MNGEHQPEPFQLGGVQLPARAHDLQRPRAADEHRQAHGTTGAGKAAPQRLGQRKRRVRGGQPDVAGQRELSRARARRTVQRGDHDLGERLQRVVEAVGGPHQVQDLRLGVARADRRIEDPHREERRAGAGQHDRLDLVVARQRIHVALQRQQDLAGQAVLVGGPIDGDGGDPAVAAKHHLCAGHATFIEADAGLVNAEGEIVGSRAAQISTRSLPGGTGCARCCAMRLRARKLRDLIVVRRHHPAPDL